ncbi:hypothetical protein [Streptomyces sp. NPDC020681]|uniref:hypothetical protein n=1 Tax=Streptomyces sp. NPDC020681 TaxID=3365083 RepID=UPI0037A4C56F
MGAQGVDVNAFGVFDRIVTATPYYLVALLAIVVLLAFLAVLGCIARRAAWWLDRQHWHRTATFDTRFADPRAAAGRPHSELLGQAPFIPTIPGTDRDALDTCRAIWDTTHVREDSDRDRRNT